MTDTAQLIDTAPSPMLKKIAQWVDAVRSQVQWDAIAAWQFANHAGLNQKRHIAWPKGRVPLELKQVIVLPERLQDYAVTGMTVRLALTWWAESAQVVVNGLLVQEGDLFDHSARIVLSQSAQAGDRFEVVIRLISPGHDDGALMRSRLMFESDYNSDYNALDPGFVADEVAVLASYLQTFAPAELALLAAQLPPLEAVADGQLDQELARLRDRLRPYSAKIKRHKISLLGHAHLDMAWLWPIADTWRAAERTFESVLKLQRDFPEMTFCHTTPLLYEWMEIHRPERFAQIKQQIQAGQWEALGGMWIEPELNLIDAESIVRQILYGQRYYQAKFGLTSRIAWLPDTFGFCWQLPQLLKQGGMDYFVTQKLRWNDTSRYPHEIFHWRSPDGTEIFSLMSAPIGEGIDPIKLSHYCWEWMQRTGGDLNPLWLPGMGDHGGGPTRDMLEIARRWQTSPFFPVLEFVTAEQYLDRLAQRQLSADPANSDRTNPDRTNNFDHPSNGVAATPQPDSQLATPAPLPTHDRDIYLELHRGCYTVHADQKAYNRDSQNALYTAELWNTIAQICLDRPYPQQNSKLPGSKCCSTNFMTSCPVVRSLKCLMMPIQRGKRQFKPDSN